MLNNGDGILINKSLAAHYYRLSADQGIAVAQFNYGLMLNNGDGISINKSLAAHYFKLSADQGSAVSQYCYALWLFTGEILSRDTALAIDYLQRAADGGFVFAQLHKPRDILNLHTVKTVLPRGWTMELLYCQDFLVDLTLPKLEINLHMLHHRIGLLRFFKVLCPH
jgi:TPR repeat protein